MFIAFLILQSPFLTFFHLQVMQQPLHPDKLKNLDFLKRGKTHSCSIYPSEYILGKNITPAIQ